MTKQTCWQIPLLFP